MLVLTVGDGTHAFTLDREICSFMLTHRDIRIPRGDEGVRDQHVQPAPLGAADAALRRRLLAGKEGPRGKDFNMRWVARMVADVHRILTRGGIFIYPLDAKDQEGRLRLMYEANPMAFIVEQAGGAATDGSRMLDVQPTGLHQRVPVILGSKQRGGSSVTSYHGNRAGNKAKKKGRGRSGLFLILPESGYLRCLLTSFVISNIET